MPWLLASHLDVRTESMTPLVVIRGHLPFNHRTLQHYWSKFDAFSQSFHFRSNLTTAQYDFPVPLQTILASSPQLHHHGDPFHRSDPAMTDHVAVLTIYENPYHPGQRGRSKRRPAVRDGRDQILDTGKLSPQLAERFRLATGVRPKLESTSSPTITPHSNSPGT